MTEKEKITLTPELYVKKTSKAMQKFMKEMNAKETGVEGVAMLMIMFLEIQGAIYKELFEEEVISA